MTAPRQAARAVIKLLSRPWLWAALAAAGAIWRIVDLALGERTSPGNQILWTCFLLAWIAIALMKDTTISHLNKAIHSQDQVIRRDERNRIRQTLIYGDPSVLETTFREFVDDEEAADCALAVHDLLEETAS